MQAHGAARVEGLVLPTIDACCMPVFDSTGALGLGLIALGQESRFDLSWQGPIASALRTRARKLSYELGYDAKPR